LCLKEERARFGLAQRKTQKGVTLPNDSGEKNRSQATGKKFTALFTVRRWLRVTPCSTAQAVTLFVLASFARPDGSGIHPGIDDLVELTKLDRSTVIEALKCWREASTITRTKAGNRRARQADEYKINLDWQPSKVGQNDFCKRRPGPPMDFHKSDANVHKSDGEAQRSARTTPSEDSSSSENALPSKNQPPYIPPQEKQLRGDSKEVLYSWCFEIIAIRMGRRRRLPNLDGYLDEPAQTVCDALTRKGFPARLLTGTTIVPDHIPRLDPDPRLLKSPLISRSQADYKLRKIRNEIAVGIRCGRCYKRECACPEKLKNLRLSPVRETSRQNTAPTDS
jgi:hypothetical protein